MRIGGEAPGRRAHSHRRHLVPCQLPVPATSDRQSAVRPERQRERRVGKKMLVPEAFQPAGRRMTPSNVSPVVTKRQSAISSLRASATIIVFRVPRRLSVLSWSKATRDLLKSFIWGIGALRQLFAERRWCHLLAA